MTIDSQPGCRGTQECREKATGVPPNIELTVFLFVFVLRVPQIVIFGMVGCCQIFVAFKGAVNPKRLQNTVVDCGRTLSILNKDSNIISNHTKTSS